MSLVILNMFYLVFLSAQFPSSNKSDMFALPHCDLPCKYHCQLSLSTFAFSHPSHRRPTPNTRTLSRLWTSHRCSCRQLPKRLRQKKNQKQRSRESIINMIPVPSHWVSGRLADIMYTQRLVGSKQCRKGQIEWGPEHVVICGRITCERSFCPLIEKRWRVRIRNGYWSIVTLSASTLITRQCNLTWPRKVQRCWWFFRLH